MDNRKVLLCPAGCGLCPEVELAGDQVRIGEAGNLAVLTKDEWNVLVDLIQSGQLAKVCRGGRGGPPVGYDRRLPDDTDAAIVFGAKT